MHAWRAYIFCSVLLLRKNLLLILVPLIKRCSLPIIIVYVIVQIRDLDGRPGFQSPSDFWKGRRRAFLLHEGFVIPVKSSVSYLSWLLKPTSNLKYFKGTNILWNISKVLVLWNQPFYCLKSAPLSPGRISNPPPTLKTVLPPVSKDWLNINLFCFGFMNY